MRSLRITTALIAVACACGAFAAPSFAAKEKAFFGEFFAHVPNQTISPSSPATAVSKEGELDEFFIGPTEERFTWKFECEKLTSKAMVESERSETFTTEVLFHKCHASRRLYGNYIENNLPVKFSKGFTMEFHSNGAAAFGLTEGELKIKQGTTIAVKIPHSACTISIPAQTIPTKDNPEHEYEDAEYGTDVETGLNERTYPGGVKDELEVEWFLKHVIFDIPAAKGTSCEYLPEPGGKYNPETKMVEATGYFEGDLEEIQVKKGSIGFSTEKPV